MKFNSIVNISAELLENTVTSASSPENFASTFFRKNKFIGSSERKFISEILFNSLRIFMSTEFYIKNYLKKESVEFKDIIINSALLGMLAYKSLDVEEMNSLFSKAVSDSGGEDIVSAFLNTFETSETAISKFSGDVQNADLEEVANFENYFSLPKYITEKIIGKYSTETVKNIAVSALMPADLWIRPVKYKMELDELTHTLHDENIDHTVYYGDTNSIKIHNRRSLNQLAAYREGKFEIQDISSQIISDMIELKEDDKVLDACAGAGGKSLFLASKYDNALTIHAYDKHSRKLRELKKRAVRTDASSVHILSFKELQKNEYGAVIIDAPCSGSGTFSRHPSSKYTLNNDKMNKLMQAQQSLLNTYSKVVKPGGILYYITCSILPEENELNINLFLKNHPDFAYNNFSENKPPSPENSHWHTILPQKDGGDGFFIAKLKKIK